MSTLSPTNSSDAAPSSGDHRPEYQSQRADDAHPNRNEPQTDAAAGTPEYGDFGKPNSANSSASPAGTSGSNDGSNDNPDEFSELDRPDDRGTNAAAANPMDQRGHVDQNQDAAAVAATQNADHDESRAAWSADDERYAGGHRKASWEENNEAEHS